jgi:hypothetical protein
MTKPLFLFFVAAVLFAQTAAPPPVTVPPPVSIPVEAVSAYFLKVGQSLTDPAIAGNPDATPPIPPQYKWAHINAPLTGDLDATNTLQLGVTLPPAIPGPAGAAGVPGQPGADGVAGPAGPAGVAGASVQPRTCSFSFEDGLQLLTPGANTYSFMGCPNNTGVPWTVTGIHCWSDNIGFSTADVVNNAGASFMLMPVLCSATQAGGGTAGALANAPPNLSPSSANTTLAPGDAFNIKLVSDGITMDFRVTVDYQ